MRDQFIKKLSELALKDPRIVLITGDLGFRVLDNYIKDFPNQFINPKSFYHPIVPIFLLVLLY